MAVAVAVVCLVLVIMLTQKAMTLTKNSGPRGQHCQHVRRRHAQQTGALHPPRTEARQQPRAKVPSVCRQAWSERAKSKKTLGFFEIKRKKERKYRNILSSVKDQASQPGIVRTTR